MATISSALETETVGRPHPRFSVFLDERIGPLEQVAEGPPAPISQTPAAQVLGPIVDQMTALAPGCEITVAVEAGVVLAVARR